MAPPTAVERDAIVAKGKKEGTSVTVSSGPKQTPAPIKPVADALSTAQGLRERGLSEDIVRKGLERGGFSVTEIEGAVAESATPQPTEEPLPSIEDQKVTSQDKAPAPIPTEEPAAIEVTPAPTPEPPTPEEEAPAIPPHTVQGGDNLSKIAQQFGVSLQDLIGANPQIENINLIRPGEKINIPDGAVGLDLTAQQKGRRFDGLDENGLFEAIKSGDIRADSIDPVWRSLYRDGVATAVQIAAHEMFQNYNRDLVINGTQQMTIDAIGKAEGMKGLNAASKATLKEAEENSMKNRLAETNASLNTVPNSIITTEGTTVTILGDLGSERDYNELSRNNERLNSFKDEAAIANQEMAEIEAAELGMVNDILKEVEGNASQSYIQALAARRSRDLYPRKFALQSKINGLNAQIADEKEHIANLMNFRIQDKQFRFDAALKSYDLTVRAEGRAEDKEQNQFERDFALQKLLFTIPENKTFTVGGIEYKGLGSDVGGNIIKTYDAQGNEFIVSIDSEGNQKFKTFTGGFKKPGGSGGGTSLKSAKFIEQVRDGKVFSVPLDPVSGQPRGEGLFLRNVGEEETDFVKQNKQELAQAISEDRIEVLEVKGQNDQFIIYESNPDIYFDQLAAEIERISPTTKLGDAFSFLKGRDIQAEAIANLEKEEIFEPSSRVVSDI